jgi:P-type E1-E2 ATPase
MGLPLAILTGDEPGAAERLASSLAFQGRVLPSLSPEAKARQIQEAVRRGERPVFVGDGLNDGPALAAAHLGVAVQGATEVATATAHLVLLGGGPGRLPEALRLARRARRVMLQNLAWAAGYNVLAIPAAVAGKVTPALAALLMALSSVSVVLNALRLSAKSPPRP